MIEKPRLQILAGITRIRPPDKKPDPTLGEKPDPDPGSGPDTDPGSGPDPIRNPGKIRIRNPERNWHVKD